MVEIPARLSPQKLFEGHGGPSTCAVSSIRDRWEKKPNSFLGAQNVGALLLDLYRQKQVYSIKGES